MCGNPSHARTSMIKPRPTMKSGPAQRQAMNSRNSGWAGPNDARAPQWCVRRQKPTCTGPNALVEARAKFAHELSKLIIGAVALHVTGALKHHFIDHDGVLSRMLPFGAGVARRRI
jgi:hypothetical protein